MKLFFDARFTRTDHHDGISRYGAGLLGALREIHPVTAIIHDPRQLDLLPPDLDHVRLTPPVSASELGISLQLNRLGADVVFSPMQVMGSLARRYGLILTLHDLIYYTHPSPPLDLPTPVRAAWWAYHQAYWPQRFMLDRADVVATVSQASKEQILAHRLTKRPVVVVPNAAQLGPAPQSHPGAQSRNLIYMGSFMPYKDVETLLAAMAYLPGYTLHLLSRADNQRLIRLSALVPDGAHVVFHDGVSEEQYIELLRTSHALVSASLDEGFGLPLLEAMSQGLPAVVTDIPAFAEVGGGAALRFPERNAIALAAAVRKLADPAEWQRASQAALTRSHDYSWGRSASRLLAAATKVHEIRGRIAARREGTAR